MYSTTQDISVVLAIEEYRFHDVQTPEIDSKHIVIVPLRLLPLSIGKCRPCMVPALSEI